jgi:hypothetical protein
LLASRYPAKSCVGIGEIAGLPMLLRGFYDPVAVLVFIVGIGAVSLLALSL